MPQATELETELGAVRRLLSRSEQGVSSPFRGVPVVSVPRAVFSAVVGLVGGKKEKKQWFLHCLERFLGARQCTEHFLEISSHLIIRTNPWGIGSVIHLLQGDVKA